MHALNCFSINQLVYLDLTCIYDHFAIYSILASILIIIINMYMQIYCTCM